MMCRCWLLQGVGDEYTIDEPIPEELLTEDLPDAVVASDDESSENGKQSPSSEEKHQQENHFNEDTHIDDELPHLDEDELRKRK